MKAVVCTRYGPPEVLELTTVPTPVPGPGEVQIRTHATTVHVGDTRIRAFRVPALMWLPARIALGISRPRKNILGMEVAGEITAVGREVTRFVVGDEVVAFTGFGFGGYAEVICLPEAGNPRKQGMVAAKPASMSYAEAAPLAGGGITALLVLRKAQIQPGQRVLIYGASGSVGTFSVQLAKHHFGAHVTAVCSGANAELVRGLGADEVIDYQVEDFTERGESWDVVFDAVDKVPARRAKKALSAGGTYLNVEASSNGLSLAVADLVQLVRMVDEGTLRSVIDRSYPMDEIVEAHRYVDGGHKRGNVAILVTPVDQPA